MSINIDYLFFNTEFHILGNSEDHRNKSFFLAGSFIRNYEILLSILFGVVRATFPRLNLC